MFENRLEAGKKLAQALIRLKMDNPIIYALPRGGVPIGAEVALALHAPLDLILIRKLGAPGHAELAIGAIVDGMTPTTILNDAIVRELGVGAGYIARTSEVALAEIDRRRAVFRDVVIPQSPAGRAVIIVDDGLATGATMEAAVKSMRKAKASRIVVATPVAPMEAAATFQGLADDFVCLETPARFLAVGVHYRDFPQLTDADVIRIFKEYRERFDSDVVASKGAGLRMGRYHTEREV